MKERQNSQRQDADAEVPMSTRQKAEGAETVEQDWFTEVSLFNRPNAMSSEASEVTCVGCYHNS